VGAFRMERNFFALTLGTSQFSREGKKKLPRKKEKWGLVGHFVSDRCGQPEKPSERKKTPGKRPSKRKKKVAHQGRRSSFSLKGGGRPSSLGGRKASMKRKSHTKKKSDMQQISKKEFNDRLNKTPVAGGGAVTNQRKPAKESSFSKKICSAGRKDRKKSLEPALESREGKEQNCRGPRKGT